MTTSLRSLVTLVMIGMLASLTACSTPYVKQEVMANGSTTITEVTFGHDWWANLGEPDMMGVKRVKQTVIQPNGQVRIVEEMVCTHEPTHPTRLTCVEAR